MERCFAVNEATTVREGRNGFNNFNDLLALAFVHLDGRNDARFCLADISNLKGFGPINLTEEIGGPTSLMRSPPIAAGMMAWRC